MTCSITSSTILEYNMILALALLYTTRHKLCGTVCCSMPKSAAELCERNFISEPVIHRCTFNFSCNIN